MDTLIQRRLAKEDQQFATAMCEIALEMCMSLRTRVDADGAAARALTLEDTPLPLGRRIGVDEYDLHKCLARLHSRLAVRMAYTIIPDLVRERTFHRAPTTLT